MTFTLLQKKSIPAIQIDMEYYQHQETGAEHVHLKSKNSENVFLVGLRTVPTNSTGVAHILEHLALCGSERYPVRDPFFMMHSRSLNTFMNAFTSTDWTAYPFATQNKKDFNNLLKVYLDAVFFSRLDPIDFSQEGHRVEFEKPDDAGSDLVYKGVVFNEMKGDMSSITSFLGDLVSANLYTKTTYHFNSGGDPRIIPELTHDQLKAFYKKHYHPSNAMFLTFGDIPAVEHQAHFESLVLNHFQKSSEKIVVDLEPSFAAARTIVEKYPVESLRPEGAQTYIILSWLLGETKDHDDVLALELLESLLIGNSASPLMKALETTKLAKAPLGGGLCGLQSENKQMSFVCGVEGSEEKHAEAIQALVRGVFEGVVLNGIADEKIQAALHQVELSQREVSGGGYPYGLQLILECLPALVHRADPMIVLDLDHALAKLRQDCADPNFIKKLVQKWFLDNPHRLCLVALPDNQWTERRQQEEKEALQKMKQSLSADEAQKIIHQAKNLKERQERVDDISVLPKVELVDIPATIPIPVVRRQEKSITDYMAGTNGLIYEDVLVEYPELDARLTSVLPYFSACVTDLGHGRHDYLSAQERQEAVSGGVYCSSLVKIHPENARGVKAYFTISSRALNRNFSAMSSLLKDSFLDARFDELPRLRELMSQIKADGEKSIVRNGHQLAMNAAASSCHPLAAYFHRHGGLLGVKATSQLEALIDDSAELKKLSNQFQEVHAALLRQKKQFLIVGEESVLDSARAELHTLWGDDYSSNHSSFEISSQVESAHQLWTVDTEVNFCAQAFPVVGIEHADAPALFVLGAFLRQGFLHRVIREQGGAYGGGASFNPATETFRFYSYRDPRLEGTLHDFEASLDWMLSTKHAPEKLEEAILDVIGGLDKPSSPAGEAKLAFYNALYGRTPEKMMALRHGIVHVSLNDLKRVLEKYLNRDRGHVAIITNKRLAESYSDARKQVFDLS